MLHKNNKISFIMVAATGIHHTTYYLVHKKDRLPFYAGLCVSTLITRPNVSCGHPATVIFQLLGEFPSFILSWLDILIHLCLVSACRYVTKSKKHTCIQILHFFSSRAMTATLDKTSDSLFHDFILKTFGMTPFINTFPDFMAGGAVMITALFIAAGMEVCT